MLQNLSAFKSWVKPNSFTYFILAGFGLYLVWFLFVENWLMYQFPINKVANYSVTWAGQLILELFGYRSSIMPKGGENYGIFSENTNFVHIGSGCNGLEIYAIFTAFIVLLPGKVKTKLWFIPLGILILYISNAVRVALLFVDRSKSYQLFLFNHKYTYVFAVYGLVFLLWIWWITKYSKQSGTNTHGKGK